MSRLEKAKRRIKSKPKDYTFSEASALLTAIGFKEDNKGKTSGSRVRFIREKDGLSILLHKPHPGNIMKSYMIDMICDFLEENGEI